jgi:hypothetical protein
VPRQLDQDIDDVSLDSSQGNRETDATEKRLSPKIQISDFESVLRSGRCNFVTNTVEEFTTVVPIQFFVSVFLF